MPKNNKPLVRNNTESKNFSYSKGDVSLNFTLRIDVQTQLSDFKELMLVALDDVSAELNRLKGK